MRPEGRMKMGYYPTPLTVMDRIATFLSIPEEPFIALDPCVGCGTALTKLLEGTTGVGFGVEPDEHRCMEARDKGLKVLKCGIERARISNGVFSLLFLNPPYDHTTGGVESGSERMEKTFFRESIPYLKPGGVLIYVVPKYRLTEDIIKMLAYRIDDIRIYRFMDEEYSVFSQIVVFGKKKEMPYLDMDAVDYWKPFLKEDVAELPEAMFPFYDVPPMDPIEVSTFRSGIIDTEELEVMLKGSPLWDMVKDISFILKAKDDIHPPTPLHRGQVGILLPSGALNGIVGSGVNLHLVKGRAVKNTYSKIEEETGDTIEQDVLDCSVKVFTPDGKLLSLVG